MGMRNESNNRRRSFRFRHLLAAACGLCGEGRSGQGTRREEKERGREGAGGGEAGRGVEERGGEAMGCVTGTRH